MSIRLGNTMVSPLVNNGGGGGSILTITITPQQGSYDSFTWSGATTQQIADAFAAGTTIKLDFGSGDGDEVYDVAQLSTWEASGGNINVTALVLYDYDATDEIQLFYDGTGEENYRTFYNRSQVDSMLGGKQDTLTAGSNISISNGTISATDTTYSNFSGATSSVAGSAGLVPAPTTSDPDKFLKGDGTWATTPDTTYTAGTNVAISGQNVISATDTKYTAGTNVQISSGNVISATDTTYTAGTGISISNNVISATGGGGGGISLTMSTTDIGEGAQLAANTLYGVYE